ncbi:S-formylglutathione hydrolase [Reyranella sp. MMS21-HV4-11]|uniref:S-formylglutathione hydrolase n=2 Tax=Reyranella TaxID=445219 RepID=A0ABS6ILC7_9HYPH|nr:S-formylglutathione hydrolase [Reyranella sp. MMS21-HV4-11]MBU8874729.1 S-formylglutathione hydrolase [Reyranella sp. MMS21-HV4-11]
MSVTMRSEQACFGGTIGFYSHASQETGTEMKFSVFVPSGAAARPRPALYFLAGLTCTEETFMIKAGALRHAAEHGLVLVAPDTSPRGLGLPGEEDGWDFGTGAGFYLDAEAEPWRPHYRMYSYVTRELPALVEASFPVVAGRRGVFGHSMGGHGALVIALRNPQSYRSVSAFAPICNPVAVPWGEKAFGNYLGPDRKGWAAWDASLLMRDRPFPDSILVDQGLTDQFLAAQLRPEALESAAAAAGQKLLLRRHEGYDHSYWFIQSFVADHIAWHAERLGA